MGFGFQPYKATLHLGFNFTGFNFTFNFKSTFHIQQTLQNVTIPPGDTHIQHSTFIAECYNTTRGHPQGTPSATMGQHKGLIPQQPYAVNLKHTPALHNGKHRPQSHEPYAGTSPKGLATKTQPLPRPVPLP